ncbi:tetratricopeptide repeat protein [Argonema antarcticum]|uniref:tetratricopeptide repeat protein n=1 Tax=Argonema antarcticum TaxID=2942763 RepID=UPI0020123379|nr:tetratricopeptide repeat protein [Argonema antarcticum]MCL1470793.1 tetratricopeptide repeat protein [Argonema antarcticum A004/B2]
MSDSLDRYFALIDEIVQMTLKGKIRSKQQVYQMLLQGVSAGEGEIFERCLSSRITTTQSEIDNTKDEFKQAKATRSLRAIQTIQGEWERYQAENRGSNAITAATDAIANAETNNRLQALLQAIDPNQAQALNLDQVQQLAKSITQQAQTSSDSDRAIELQQLSEGLTEGLKSWQRLQEHLVSWIYDRNREKLGFQGSPEENGPWALWAKQVNSPFPKALFQTLALNQSIVELAAKQHLQLNELVELAVILQCLQRGLVNWFDKLIYDAKVGAKLSISTFLTFAVIWSQLASGFNRAGNSISITSLTNACFQITLQIFRTFTIQKYFPLYGGIFASFSGDYLRSALNYLDEPLRYVEGTQEKARILTLLGYSMGAVGEYQQAQSFHQQALEIARTAGDIPCEIANLNHISRICVAQKNYTEAINYSQRALILSRQTGERLGEANALANLGYSEVLQAQQLERVEPEVYETAINYLQQGLQISERLSDGYGIQYVLQQSKSLCYSSLGIAYIVLSQPQVAIPYLEFGLQAAQMSGDLYLQGLNLVYLAEANYSLQQIEKAIYTGSLGMYILEQIYSPQWRQTAGLLTILQGQIGKEAFQNVLNKYRSKIIPLIGVDGYDYIPELLVKYQNE